MADEKRPELSYDGFGINGPDEHRTRLAKFNMLWKPEILAHYGRLFEAAPVMLALLNRACAAQQNNDFAAWEIEARILIASINGPAS